MSDSLEPLRREVSKRFGVPIQTVRVVRSPYRVCPLGAHIDHQLGVVTAAALDQGVYFAFAPTTDRTVRLQSVNFPDEVHFSLDHVPGPQAGDWGNLARAAAVVLQTQQALPVGLVGVAQGSWHEQGLSSSAAVGCAYLLALQHVNRIEAAEIENVRREQQMENSYLGLRNGILDPAGVLLSRKNSLTVIDCESHQIELISWPQPVHSVTFLLAFSGLRKTLVGTEYNRRVGECVEATELLLRAAGRTEAAPRLRHISPEEYAAHKNKLPGMLARRAEHFFSESRRVTHGVEAWRSGDLRQFGQLMTASGESSISNYECGAQPLIDLYNILLRTPGVLGARFSGAGFRGCCVALVESSATCEIGEQVQREYAALQPTLAAATHLPVLCRTADGAELMG